MKEELIKSFLKKIKKIVTKNGCTIAPRDKNIEFMRNNFLDNNDLIEIILDLSPAECVGGPEQDRDGYDGHILKFKSFYLDDQVIYIKIRYNPPEEIVVISFHQDE